MERGKGPSLRGKAKAQHFPSDLYVLGAKSTGGDAAKRPIPSGSGERKRDAPPLPLVGGKKAKPAILRRASPPATAGIEPWEAQAIDIDPADLVDAVLESFQTGLYEKAANLVCGGLKSLKNSKWKPDTVLTVGLIYLAKLKPSLFSTDIVTQALSWLLQRDPQHNIKSKGNPTVAVLAANLLSRGYSEIKHWPPSFIKLYIEDAMGERVWVDQAECKGFVSNLLTGFGTKLPPHNINFLIPEMSVAGMSRADSPLSLLLDDDEEGGGNSGIFDSPVISRFTKCSETIEQLVLDIQTNRRQTPESITRNYLKLLASAAGIADVRVFVSTKLEIWLQNPKLMKPAQELLLSVCVNCSTHTAKDVQVIGSIVKIRLKTKALINFYLACIKELINAHPDNLFTLLKHTVYNELSNIRNPNNMAMIGVLFQAQPEESASLLADVFLELLTNKEDYLRTLRSLLREIVRVLRHDINLPALCRGLMADKRDLPRFREFEHKDRMFWSIIDLITNACFLGISPGVKDSANLFARGDRKEVQTLTNFHTMVAQIQQETVLWLKDSAIKIYRPSAPDFNHALHKAVFMDQQESYYKADMWPPESERAFMFRLLAEVPLFETTVYAIISIGLSREHPVTALDALDLVDQLVKRTAALANSDIMPMLQVNKPDWIDLVLKLTVYHHPDNITLPPGCTPPKLAVTNSYWKAWVLLLIVCAHNPTVLGFVAWDKYPILRMFMEMCITNHFSYPPPTMPDSTEESRALEVRQMQLEKDQIIEFEKILAAATSKVTITEATSLLLPQLMTMDVYGPARKPPAPVLEQLQALNGSHKLGHLLCRSRHPDFLLDLIQKQGASQSMPWLADLVENSESSLSHLPLQCLCEFLLTSGPIEQQSKGQQLVIHLKQVLTSPDHDSTAPCEIVEYLLRRLGSQNMHNRAQAIKGLKLVLDVAEEPITLPSYLQENAWLLTQLPKLPHFPVMRSQVIAALRQACLVENDPSNIASYIQFLAVHATNDDLNSMGLLVHDMAQLIVERSTIMNAIVPDGNTADALRSNTLHSLMLIFYSYLSTLRQPRGENYQWTDIPDQVVVTWSSGEEATLHLLVVQAIVILLSHGVGNDKDLYERMLDFWFPLEGEPPTAFSVDTSEETPLIPDWLKLRMIRSGVPRLVDAALEDLAPQQMVLFIQSFGIPISSMSRLFERLDAADPSSFSGVNFQKAYMAQLVQVQQRRGVTGGQNFLKALGQKVVESHPPAFKKTVPKNDLILPSTGRKFSGKSREFQLPKISVLFNEVFSANCKNRAQAFRDLQKMLLIDVKPEERLQGVSLILQHLMTIVQNHVFFKAFLKVLQEDPLNSCLVIRLIWTKLQSLPASFQAEFVSHVNQILRVFESKDTSLHALLLQISKTRGNTRMSVDLSPISAKSTISAMLDGARENIGQVIDHLVATEPELMGNESENEMRMLLFGKPPKTETAGGVIEECRPYLLTLLTHRASWDRLHTLVNQLLSQFLECYSPTAVLDFLEAMTRNPRLWQGREKHEPKHKCQEPVLILKENQVVCLLEYIFAEAELEGTKAKVADEERPTFLDVLETRLPLLLECLDEDFFPRIVEQLTDTHGNVSTHRGEIGRNFLVLLYFNVPGLINNLRGTDHETMLKTTPIRGRSCSTLDKLSHSLLTALTSSFDPRDGAKKSHEYELAARKMASVHPVLVLRQLPMLAASLMGRVNLDFHVLKTRNHINVFGQVLGLLELLQPVIFSATYRQHFHQLLDAYLTLYKLHGHMSNLIHMVPRFVAFLQNYILHEATAATKYLQANSQALAAIQKRHRNLKTLRSLMSSVLTLREDGDDTEGQQSVVVTTSTDLPTAPPSDIVTALSKGSNEEDLLPHLQELDHLSSRNPAILEVVSEPISELLVSPYSSIRSVAYTLFARLLKHNPRCTALSCYLRALDSGHGEIVQAALEKLPDIVVTAQEHAVHLLGKAFSLAVNFNVATTDFISQAVAMLNQQTGC